MGKPILLAVAIAFVSCPPGPGADSTCKNPQLVPEMLPVPKPLLACESLPGSPKDKLVNELACQYQRLACQYQRLVWQLEAMDDLFRADAPARGQPCQWTAYGSRLHGLANAVAHGRPRHAGQTRAKAKGAVGCLGGLLRDPPVEDYDKDFFVLHVAQALEGIGFDARPAIPALLKKKGTDPTLDIAIDSAVQSILQAPAPTPPAAPPSKAIKELIEKDLKNKSDPTVRLAAAKLLGTNPNATDAGESCRPCCL